MKRRYGWRPQMPDKRDYLLWATKQLTETLPTAVDLRIACPAVYDQGELGSCTANAIAGAFQFDLMKQVVDVFIPSRLFIYYNERLVEGTVDYDAGGVIRDGVKAIGDKGVCPETDWPYDINNFTHEPSVNCYAEAELHKAVKYESAGVSLFSCKNALAQGFPVVFGFTVYESFESPEVAKTGIVPMPAAHEETLGGHAVLAVGFDDSKRWLIVRNSWGETWGGRRLFLHAV